MVKRFARAIKLSLPLLLRTRNELVYRVHAFLVDFNQPIWAILMLSKAVGGWIWRWFEDFLGRFWNGCLDYSRWGIFARWRLWDGESVRGTLWTCRADLAWQERAKPGYAGEEDDYDEDDEEEF